MTATPGRYRKKPVKVEAILWTGRNLDDVQAFTGPRMFDSVNPGTHPDRAITAQVFDKLHSTWVGVKTGQMVIKGVAGEFYPCDDDVFTATYDPA